MFLSIPFFSTLKHLINDRQVMLQLRRDSIGNIPFENKRVLWFTDTINDLNGVTVTLRKFAESAYTRDLPLELVVSSPHIDDDPAILPNIMNLPCIHAYTPKFYDSYTMHIPSPLSSLKLIYKGNPDEIIVSTPGPVGLLGILAAKLLKVPCRGVYHTDFSYQASLVLGNNTFVGLIEMYIRWFYSLCDEIRVPTMQYVSILQGRDYDRSRMKLLKRGFDIDVPEWDENLKAQFRSRYKMKEGFTLLWAGRVSKDKNIEFLARTYKRLLKTKENVNLIICGDGPGLDEIKDVLKGHTRVLFTGRISNRLLLNFYLCADLFVFPSTTDTFGMVVLEAQSCGLPVIVSDRGGPQEIINDGKTGFVLTADNIHEWVDKIIEMIRLKEENPDDYRTISKNARQLMKTRYTWDEALDDLLNIPVRINTLADIPCDENDPNSSSSDHNPDLQWV